MAIKNIFLRTENRFFSHTAHLDYSFLMFHSQFPSLPHPPPSISLQKEVDLQQKNKLDKARYNNIKQKPSYWDNPKGRKSLKSKQKS